MQEGITTSFKSKTHGFNFGNSFTNIVVDTPIDDITTKGLCGGMSYAALDYFNAGKAISPQNWMPTTGTTLRNYLYQRQVNSLVDNADKWAELTFNPFGWRDGEFFRWGLQKEARVKELRAAIDAGRPVPLGLKDGGGGGDHQVVAIGYELGAYSSSWQGYPNLKITVYDPNYPNDTRTIVADTTAERWIDQDAPSRKWISYFVDGKYVAKTPPTAAPPSSGLVVSFKTGADDLRGGNDNLNLVATMKDGTTKTFSNVNGSDRWLIGSLEQVAVSLANPENVASVKLQTTFSGGGGGDNWNVDNLEIHDIVESVKRTRRYYRRGGPLKRFTGDASTLTATVSDDIIIRKADSRTITDLQVSVDYDIPTASRPTHQDWEQVFGAGVAWTKDRKLEIADTSGTYADGVWTGDFLKLASSQPSSCNSQGCLVSIKKKEPRPITGMTVYVWFKVNGEWHHDWQDGSFGQSLNCGGEHLVLKGEGGTWDSSCQNPSGGQGCWTGDFLYRSRPTCQ